MEKRPPLERFSVALFIAGLFLVGLATLNKSQGTSYPVTAYFFDVGQGDAEMIRVENDKELLIDGGPNNKINSELGKVLTPFDNQIEAVIVTHMHADHIAGLNYLLDKKSVGKIYLFKADYDSPDAITLNETIKAKNIPVEVISGGQEIDFYGVKIKVFWPVTGTVSKDENDYSLAFSAQYKACSYLFLGDLSAEKQKNLPIVIEGLDVIKISHHGSKTGTVAEMIARLVPEYSVIEVGKDNRFGHPSPTTLEKLTTTKVLRTDERGTIKFGCDGQNNLLLQ